MKAIDNLLIKAETALLKVRTKDKKDITLVKNDEISSTKVGAIAGFGAMVINIGLLPTLAVFKANNPEILEALVEVSGESFANVKAANSDISKKRLLTEKFINASVALKIMARTFNLNKEDGKQ